MRRDTSTPEDRELLADFDRAARATGLEPCLIGAGAIQLGPAAEWDLRPRMTRDWDFAVRVDSWPTFERLAEQLTGPKGGFEHAREAHRFHHRSGGLLDVVPYGALEEPEGTLRWSDATVMETRGLRVLDQHHQVRRIGDLELRIASLPALVGLKLLAYLSRRPSIVRDIGDAHRLLVESENRLDNERIEAEALDRLASGAVSMSEVGAYLLGRDVGRIFADADRAALVDLIDESDDDSSSIVPNILRAPDSGGTSSERVRERLVAFRLGVLDRS